MHTDHPAEAVWEQLRATRWNPPAPAATTDERRATYVFALEQAEQMFRAATTVGPATRPLLVFYGLSQAGRAIMAAASSIGSGDAWKLNGHGISSVALDGNLPDVEVRTGKTGDRGSFVRLSELLVSPLWGKARVRLHVLWDLLPENEQSPLLDTGSARRTPLWIEHRNLYPERHPLASVPVVRFPPWIINSDNGRKALDDYLKAFPDAQGYYDFLRIEDDPKADPKFSPHQDGWGELDMHWRLPGGRLGTPAERLALLESLTRPYKETLYFFPVIAPNSHSLHPLMAWWAVLHTLSMLARYQPAEWASHINVDTSQHAIAIERLLKEAIRTVPRLVAEAIDQVV
ncbi:YaaC family protein [Saccharomonospora piscinae]|uniref:YaaC family protein n=1 Tax=Saccharomonospora piscinae TaxID=687388 RepID=UPI000465223F|nr:YaaC family protein [Saccharomonospora piscinae]